MSKRPEDTELGDELLDKSYERLKDIEPPAAVDRQIMALAASEASKAKQGSGTSWRIWRWRIATVAVAVLAFSVTLRIVTDAGRGPDLLELPVGEEPKDSMAVQPGAPARSAPVDEAAVDAAPAAADAPLRAERSLAIEEQEEVIQTKAYGAGEQSANSGVAEDDDGLAMQSSMKEASPQEVATGPRKDALSMLAEPAVGEDNLPESVRADPDRWLEAIDDLLDQGRRDWARREIGLFRERFPDRKLDAKYDID